MSGIGFSAPWLLLAALAAAVPVVAHLARHEDRDGRAFPSLMFLRRVPFPTRSRRKLVDRALLALRVLAVLALVLSFAQPYLAFDDPHAAAPQRARVVLLDRSYSMAGGERFAQALRAAQDALRVDDDGTRVALVVFDASARTLSGFDAAPAAALQALQAVRPGNRATDLSKALAYGSRLLATQVVARRELVLISDLQLSGLGADLALASDIELQVHRVDDDVANNLAVLGAWYDERDTAEDAAIALYVRIVNTGSAASDSLLRVAVDGLRAARQQISLAPGARRELQLPIFAARDRPTRVQLTLNDDALALDNARYLLIAPPRAVNVLWVSGSSHGNAYVNAALSSSSAGRQAAEQTAEQRPEQVAVRSTAAWGTHSLSSRGMRVQVKNVDVTAMQAAQIDDADVIVLDGVTAQVAQTAQLANAIQHRVEQGAGLLSVRGGAAPDVRQISGRNIARGSGPVAAQLEGPLADVLAGVQAAQARAPVMASALAALTPEHAIAAALGDASLSDIAVWRYEALVPKPGDQVLARFDDGAPALLERVYGRGRSITMALSLQPQSSNLVLDPVFVPWLVETLLHLSQRAVARVHYGAGDVLDVLGYADSLAGGEAVTAALRARRTVQLRAPGGGVQQLRANAQHGSTSPVLGETGFYELHVANAPPLPIAVNPQAAEARLDALDVAQFQARIERTAALASSTPRSVPGERRDHRIARWLLWLAIVALLAEALFGAWLARRRASPGGRRVAAPRAMADSVSGGVTG